MKLNYIRAFFEILSNDYPKYVRSQVILDLYNFLQIELGAVVPPNIRYINNFWIDFIQNSTYDEFDMNEYYNNIEKYSNDIGLSKEEMEEIILKLS